MSIWRRSYDPPSTPPEPLPVIYTDPSGVPSAAPVELSSPSTSDGKPIMLPCLFPGNTFLYLTGAGDDITNGIRGSGQAFKVLCTTEQDYSVEFQFIDWVYLAGGGIEWRGGEYGDWVSLLIYAPATTVIPNGSHTGNCNLVDPGVGQAILIVPAAGNGAYDVDLNHAAPVPSYVENDMGVQVPNGFYNWSVPDAGSGIITVGTPQASFYNLFVIDINLVRFANQLQLLTDGIKDLTVPAIKPKRILPQWKFKATVRHVSGNSNLMVQWWLVVARTKTL